MSLKALKNVSPVKFYGKGVKKVECSKKKPVVVKYVLRDLLNGPSLIWKTFRRQEEALEYQRLCKGGLMTFAYETAFGAGRQFLVAHPEVFWHYNIQREPEERCTYEIVPENTVSKIYLDLEFNKGLNPGSDGELMVQAFIDIITFYLKKHFKIECLRENILDLDSSSDSKFSRHLIFNLPNHAFIDNKNVGNFIKKICSDLKRANPPPELSTIKLEIFKSLFVTDSKNNRVLFCDEGVYTKNRHFRCYQNTKKGKNSPLVLSKSNIFKCENELQYFLSSLITIVKNDVQILQYSTENEDIKYQRDAVPKSSSDDISTSPYPMLDKFINDYVKPGKIYRSVYFSSSKTLVYDIVNNRFCGNIGREHKSNNVKYIVNIDCSTFYQKCHDWECRAYRSDEIPLPAELCKAIRLEESLTNEPDRFGLFGVCDEISPEVLDEIENKALKKRKLEHFPSFGLSDEEFLQIDTGI